MHIVPPAHTTRSMSKTLLGFVRGLGMIPASVQDWHIEKRHGSSLMDHLMMDDNLMLLEWCSGKQSL